MLLMGVRLVRLMTVCWGGGNHNDRDCHVAAVGEGRDGSSADCDDGDVFVQIVIILSIASDAKSAHCLPPFFLFQSGCRLMLAWACHKLGMPNSHPYFVP